MIFPQKERGILLLPAKLHFSKKSLIHALLLTSVGFSGFSHAASPFTTEAKFSVGSDGSANYSIPIVVPPGTAGMQPQLALNYNSNGGNGIVGMGWGIDGLSQISRCPTTLEQDGVINGVNYTNTDRFCIDGQRLIATSDTYNTSTKQYSTTSAYGANGTEYRTESANFAKIVSYGAAGTGPAYFKVWTKSGQIIEYGNTADAAIEAQGKPTIRTWGVNKISDTKGNYITVTYTEDNANGEAYVSRIDYTGNASSTPALTPYANVQFVYEARPDTTTAYQAGSILKTTKRLTNIQTYTGTTIVKNYKLVYTNNGAYHTNTSNVADGSLLVSVQECDGSTTPICKQATSLTWTPGTVNATVFGTAQGFGLPAGATILASGDVNGDGLADVIYNYKSGNTQTTYLAIGNGSTFVNTSTLASATSTTTCTTFSMGGCGGYTTSWSGSMITSAILSDVNGDGLADLLTGSSVMLSAGSSFGASQNWGVNNIVASGDVNGDGKSDVIYNVASGNTMTSYLATSNGVTFNNVAVLGSSTSTQTCSSGYSIWTCNGPLTVSWTGNAIFGGFLADMNGDGLADLVAVYGGGVQLSNKTGFGAAQNWGFSQVLAVGDINGDGLADVVHNVVTADTAVTYLALSNSITGQNASVIGSSQITMYCPSGSYSMSGCNGGTVPVWNGTALNNAQIGDLNRDGMQDLIINAVGFRGQIMQSSDQLSSITSGVVVNSIVYNKLAVNGLYVADNSSSYPVRDIASNYPIYVVSSATVSDGLGGVVTTNYQYGGLKAHLRGRGSLGFRYVKESSPDSGLSVTTFYRQDFPFIGLPSQVEKRRLSDNALLSVVQNTYANTDLATGTMLSKFPYLSQSVEQAYELDGSLVSTTTTTNQYDGYGNVTSVQVDDGVGNTKTTTSTYKNDVGNWLLGRLIRSTVSSTTP